jgi:chitodextrinase
MKKTCIVWPFVLLLVIVVGLVSCSGKNSSNNNNGSADTTAPSVPTGLLASAVTSTQISLTWTASADNVAVTGYNVYRSTTQLSTTAAASYLDSGLTASTQYCYTVSAYDAAGNASAASSQACATTLASPSTSATTEFPIATTSGREISIGAAFDGTNYLVGIEGDQNNGNNITAQLVSGSTGSLVGSRISIGRTGGAPYVAFDGTNYLMVWDEGDTNPRILYGQRISMTGQLVGSAFSIAQIGDKADVVIIFDGANYFVVWDTRGESDTSDIYGQFISPSGTLLGTAIPVSTASHGQREPAVAFDGTNILVVWGDGRNQSAYYTDPGYVYPISTHFFESDVYGQFVTKSAPSTMGSLTGSNFLINASSLPRDNPKSLAFDGTNYFVVFNEQTTLPNACPASGCKWDIYGQFVTKTGIPTGSKITISNGAPNHQMPNVVWNGTKYLATWTENFGSLTTSIKGRYFDTSGAPIGSELNLFSAGNNGSLPWYATPIVKGTNYFMIVNRGIPGTDPYNFDAYTSQDVYGAFIAP